jgi:hypothetical protein
MPEVEGARFWPDITQLVVDIFELALDLSERASRAGGEQV